MQRDLKKSLLPLELRALILLGIVSCSAQIVSEQSLTNAKNDTNTATEETGEEAGEDEFTNGQESSRVTGASLASAGPECEATTQADESSFTCHTYYTPADSAALKLTSSKVKATELAEGYTVTWTKIPRYKDAHNGLEFCTESNHGLSITCRYPNDNNNAIIFDVEQIFMKDNQVAHSSANVAKFKNDCDGLPSVTNYDAFGSGVAGDPYIVCYAGQLWDFANNGCNGTVATACAAHIRIGRDMDGSGVVEMIGAAANPYTGHFFGNGYVISNISLAVVGKHAGIFQYIGNGAILDYFTMKDCSLNTTGGGGVGLPGYGGVLVGIAQSGSEIRKVTVENCTLHTFGTSDVLGGIVGRLYGTIRQSSVSENTRTNGSATIGRLGGAAGIVEIGGTIIETYADSSLNAQGGRIGGLAGENKGSIINSYSNGQVKFEMTAGGGGFVGMNSGTITSSYSSSSLYCEVFVVGVGAINDCTNAVAGGFVGTDVAGTYSGNYFDKDVATITDATDDSGGDVAGITGKTTAQMKTQSTFSGWNFTNIWKIDTNAYPSLAWQ